jgi:branched-chain amino acid transport system permease protein
MFSQLLINSLIAASVYTLVAVSFSLIYSTTRFFHFAHAVVFTAGAYFAYLFYILLGLPLVIAVGCRKCCAWQPDRVVYLPAPKKNQRICHGAAACIPWRLYSFAESYIHDIRG